MKHSVKTEKFTGPISVLHDMIESRKLSISEFSLLEITEDFINYVRGLEYNSEIFDNEEITHFVSIASILILLKSKTLLPDLEISQEEDRDIQILTNQVECFAILKEHTKTVRDAWGHKMFLSAKVPYKNHFKIFVPDQKMDLNYFENYVHSRLLEIEPNVDEKKHVRVDKKLKIEDALEHVRSIIKRIKNFNFNNINNGGDERLREKNKRNVVILFLAVLELVKIGEIDVTQNDNFSDIIVTDATLS